jgi:hypothetical protein
MIFIKCYERIDEYASKRLSPWMNIMPPSIKSVCLIACRRGHGHVYVYVHEKALPPVFQFPTLNQAIQCMSFCCELYAVDNGHISEAWERQHQ